jgi:hypothetical protein
VKTRIIEATNGEANWGKFLIGVFDSEWEYKSVIDGNPLVASRGWSKDHFLVLDLQTGEGSLFHTRGMAKADLDKHRIWVCPLFEPFLQWLYTHPDPLTIPAHIDLPDAPFHFAGYRRKGPDNTK